MDCSTSAFSVHHQLPELAQTHVWVGDAIQPSRPLPSPHILKYYILLFLFSIMISFSTHKRIRCSIFPIVMYGYESWTIKKAECRRIDAVELWYWRRLLGVPWTARRSNQWILNEISPEYWLEGLMLKLKLQYFGHLMGRTDSFEYTLMLGKIEGRRRRGQ